VVTNNGPEPKGYTRLVKVWWAMWDASEVRPGFENPVWSGSFYELIVRKVRENERYSRDAKLELIGMGCIRQVSAGPGVGTTLELLRPPDYQTYTTACGRPGTRALRKARREANAEPGTHARTHKEVLAAWFRARLADGGTESGIVEELKAHRSRPAHEQRQLTSFPCLGHVGGTHTCGIPGLDSQADK
jgi:hypothetical protein